MLRQGLIVLDAMDRISRTLLARAGERRVLSQEAMGAALDLSGLRPSRAEWRQFTVLAMRFAAVLSLAAGMVFLVAFNWQTLGLYARFAMVEAPLLTALIIAWAKGTDPVSGKLSLMLAVLLTGCLLALFGQTYQTGANLYELFFAWAALALPWVMACRYAPCWALWLLLINTAVGLYAGAMGTPDLWRWTPWLLPFALDVAIYVALIGLSRCSGLGLGERWLQRAVMAAAMAFGTGGMLSLIVGFPERIHDAGTIAGLEIALFLAASVGFGAYAHSQKEDLFNFAVVGFAWIVVTTAWIGRALLEGRAGPGGLFLIALYVIVASTAAIKGIAYIGRSWKTAEAVS